MTSNSFFFLQAEENEDNSSFMDNLRSHSREFKIQMFVVNKPLGDAKYLYEYKQALVLLIPNHKITFIDFGNGGEEYERYCDDFIEDLGSISDKYRYKSTIGRRREWENLLIKRISYDESCLDVNELLKSSKLHSGLDQKRCELLISLLTGSINDIDKVKGDVPETILDKVKQKILLFDGDQSRFVYEKSEHKKITIQGLSGTGKTELLLHKLKEIYTTESDTKIIITCHNHVLANTLKKRIPDFFNFMKVEEQIKWNE